MKQGNSRLVIMAIAAVIVVACCALVCLATALLVSCQPPTLSGIVPTPTVQREVRLPSATPTGRQQAEPTAERTPPVKPTALPSPTVERTVVEVTPTPLASTEERLSAAVLPIRDMRDLSLRLRAEVDDIPVVVNATPPQFEVGDVDTEVARDIEAHPDEALQKVDSGKERAPALPTVGHAKRIHRLAGLIGDVPADQRDAALGGAEHEMLRVETCGLTDEQLPACPGTRPHKDPRGRCGRILHNTERCAGGRIEVLTQERRDLAVIP